MGRIRQTTNFEDRFAARLESDRRRSQAYRDRISAARRPSSGQADRAIVMALREIWAASIDQAGADPQARAAAMGKPISAVEIGARAAAHLARLDRADPEQARLAVLARMRPVPSRRNVRTADRVTSRDTCAGVRE
ncbi:MULTISPECIES: hypothetical protein [Methylopilaceae]|uniref:Uncharacterized protein n=2 Tax=Methylopilaceae TaxID=3149309 RepID=A0A4Q0M9T0_9HYPH|nr:MULTISPECIES: hypothetical protein [Methylocystaceae]QZO00551.1 hypothetical protein K6K41_02130 [Chenggangzhangella methanolivorans]RXF69978.1 hypothetical protein EK403_17795 [Hansschlegelia zhihuaiae]